VTNKWELQIPTLAHPRGRLGLAVVGSQLFAIGGDDGDGDAARMGKMVEVSCDQSHTAPAVSAFCCDAKQHL
jgi:hypothetical protein